MIHATIAVIKFCVKPYKMQGLPQMCNTCSLTFSQHLAGIKSYLAIRRGHFYSINQIELKFAHMGRPYEVIEK